MDTRDNSEKVETAQAERGSHYPACPTQRGNPHYCTCARITALKLAAWQDARETLGGARKAVSP